MIEVYLAPAPRGKGCALLDVASGEVKLLALGVPQAWIAAAGQGWSIVRTSGREPTSLERRADETLGDWGPGSCVTSSTGVEHCPRLAPPPIKEKTT